MHEAYKVRLSLPVTIIVLHVQCHQDKSTSNPESLSIPAHLNIVAGLGTHQANKNHPHFQQTPSLPSIQGTLVLNESKVTSEMTTHASFAYYLPIMADYFHHKFSVIMSPSPILSGTPHRNRTKVSLQAVAWILVSADKWPVTRANEQQRKCKGNIFLLRCYKE